MSQKIKVIFIPGNGGDGRTDENFFPYIKNELEALGCEVTSPIFPDGMLARAKYWLPYIEELGADENTILIGHSSGAIASMRYAENHRILGSVLVAGYYTDLGVIGEKLSGYFSKPWDWDAIKHNQKFIIQFNSINDPHIPIDEAHFVSVKLTSDYHELNRGHFYPEDTFFELIESIKKYL